MMERLGLMDNDVLVAAQQRCKGATAGGEGGGSAAKAKKEKKRKCASDALALPLFPSAGGGSALHDSRPCPPNQGG